MTIHNRITFPLVVCIMFITAMYLSYQRNLLFTSRLLGIPDQKEDGIHVSAAQKSEDKVKAPPEKYVLPESHFVAQSFNNCGPASLSMVFSMFGKNISQEELAEKMRPFNNPEGGVDDKSIFADEFVRYAEEYGFEGLDHPNGTVDLLEKFVVNGVPVIVRTWLNSHEDIGHFRIVRGYDARKQILIVDDSYNGPNLEVSYDEFMATWQPFNYGYIIVYPKEKQEIVEQILDKEKDKKDAYKNALARAEKELQKNCHPEPFGHSERSEESQGKLREGSAKDSSFTTQNDSKCTYAQFNVSTAQFHLGNYDESVKAYEKAAPNLPPRMLWYQYEPIQAYQKLKSYDRVFELTDSILYSGNLAFSELYQIRGEVFKEQGNKEAAKAEFENAVYYNKNFMPAQEKLESL